MFCIVYEPGESVAASHLDISVGSSASAAGTAGEEVPDRSSVPSMSSVKKAVSSVLLSNKTFE